MPSLQELKDLSFTYVQNAKIYVHNAKDGFVTFISSIETDPKILRSKLSNLKENIRAPACVQTYIDNNFGTFPDAFNYLVYVFVLVNIFYFIGACSVYHLPNIGFSTFLSSIFSIVHNIALLEMVSNQSIGWFPHEFFKRDSHFTIGALYGVTIGMAFSMFIITIYYGQLSNCEELDHDVTQYACDTKIGMWFVWFFGGLIFLIDCGIVALFTYGKDELIREKFQYDDIDLTVEYSPSRVVEK